ncbi:MAG: GNAT family protein [Chloroflexota bacterium]
MGKANLDYSNYYWQADKIRLRGFTIDDAEHRLAHNLDSIAMELFNIGIHLPTTLDAQKAWIEKHAGCQEVNGKIAFAMETHDGEYVGFAMMHSIDERHGKFWFSVIVNRQHQRRGYAEEAVRLILKYGFLERRMHKCTSACASYNPASIRLHEKLGFTLDGRLREESFYNGQHHDELMWGLTLEDYLAKTHLGE